MANSELSALKMNVIRKYSITNMMKKDKTKCCKKNFKMTTVQKLTPKI